MRLFRLIIYIENKENLTYIASTTKKTKKRKKKNGILALFQKTTGAIVSRGHKYFAHTHTYTHTQEKNNEKLVLICPPPLYPQPATRKERGKLVHKEAWENVYASLTYFGDLYNGNVRKEILIFLILFE